MAEFLGRSGGPTIDQMSRISLRYRGAATRAALAVPVKKFFGREHVVDIEAELIDVSVGGALVDVPEHDGIREGIRLDLLLDGEACVVGLRHVGSAGDGRCRCGVAFRDPSPAFEAVVHETIASLIVDPKRNEAWRMNG